jgi:hypothetical protein
MGSKTTVKKYTLSSDSNCTHLERLSRYFKIYAARLKSKFILSTQKTKTKHWLWFWFLSKILRIVAEHSV